MRQLRSRFVLVVAITGGLSVFLAPCDAAVIHVDCNGGGDFLAIQEGIDAASPGDTVAVAAGVYYEHLLIDSDQDGISLLSEDGPSATVIDGQGATALGPLLHIDGSTSRVVAAGFTFRDNHVRGSSWGGGAVYVDSSCARIEGCIIEDCTASWDGGGIYTYSSDAQIVGNTVRRCAAAIGGGISAYTGSALIQDNQIVDNESVGWDTHWGAGICVEGVEPAEVISNTISRNSNFSTGGGVYARYTDVTITGNSITDNVGGYGSAILFHDVGSASLEGNTISGNHPYQGTEAAVLDFRGDGAGAGLTCDDNIITLNDGIALMIRSGGHATMHNCHVAGNTDDAVKVLSSVPAGTLSMTGNWWGTTDPSAIAELIWDCVDDSTVAACVDYSDWCDVPDCSGNVTHVPEASGKITSWGALKWLLR